MLDKKFKASFSAGDPIPGPVFKLQTLISQLPLLRKDDFASSERLLYICYGLPCNAKRRCNMYMYLNMCIYIHIWVITCRTPQPSNIQPCSSREGRALIHRFPLSLGTDLTHTIFGNNISTLERRGGKDMETSQVSASFHFKR